MNLMILALLQAVAPAPPAPPPPAPPAFVESPADDGGFALTINSLPADRMSERQGMLDAAAAKRRGAKRVVAGEQSYDQSTNSNGLPAPLITHLRMTYRCA